MNEKALEEITPGPLDLGLSGLLLSMHSLCDSSPRHGKTRCYPSSTWHAAVISCLA